ncbi:centrosomal protein of 95 kDa isoform X2 [Ambystoma mexicanum]|uniref:centrosomal protein of 95 kDa isoform X2 n=1 Tax=Ambystoma mexicanum TaxID=8296 RepID=UPI0037E80F2F
MGTEEKEWTDVANDLLAKCHIHLKVKDLKGCDANVFVALYESILGEKVPDFIAAARSPEDNAHNVQAIIDSLALDYLQVSLSHITGENIIKGDKESIKNLLEIFDGLLEYLTEQISEASSQTGDDVDLIVKNGHERGLQLAPGQRQKECGPVLKVPSSIGSSVQSSSILIPSWDVEGSESTGELIKLGETAHTFTLRKSVPELERTVPLTEKQPDTTFTIRQDDVKEPSKAYSPTFHSQRHMAKKHLDNPVNSNGFPEADLQNRAQIYGEPIRSAIPLQPPYQPTDPRHGPLIGRTGSRLSPDIFSSPSTQHQRPTEPSKSIMEQSRPLCKENPVTALQPTTALPQSTVDVPQTGLPGPSNATEMLISRPSRKAQRHVNQQEHNGTTTAEGPALTVQKKVAFRTMPDVRFMTLRSEQEEWHPIGEDEEATLEESHTDPSTNETRTRAGYESSYLTSHVQRKEDASSMTDEPLSRRRAKDRLSEQELQEMSENLTRKLNELDLMLKQALGEHTIEDDVREEDKLSQHSDSFMEYRRKKHQPGTTHHRKTHSRPRSLTSSPPLAPLPSWYTLHMQFEDALNKDAKGQMKSLRREIQKELDLQRVKAKFVSNAYEEEIKSYEDKERIKIAKLKAQLKEKEQEYKENLFQDLPKTSQPAKVYSRKTTPQKSKPSEWSSGGGAAKPRKATPMKIKENDLLPLLLDEFPYLHVSPHTLNKMWKHQFSQMEQLTKSASEEDRNKARLQNEVEVAQKKHDLLVEIIRKEQGHNQRLQDFKDRIRQQKSTQNKMRDKRQQIARAKKYYEDYHVQLRAKMMRAKTREERIFKNLFEEGLEIQKERLRDIRMYANEKREEQKKRHTDELESMENYYKDQFSMLAEAVSQERHEIKAREKAQENTLNKMKRGLRSKMEKEIRELQEIITKNDDDAFFRELEAERLKRRLQMASFQYSKSHLL